jgi:hypothetical protein
MAKMSGLVEGALVVGGVAAVGGLVYALTRPSTTTSTTSTVYNPSTNPVTTQSQWNAMTPAQQSTYAAAWATQTGQQAQNFLATVEQSLPS